MNTWPTDTLHAIVAADDLHVAPLRDDNATFGTPTWVWCVEVAGNLYVRAYNGQRSRWYRAAVSHEFGRIKAAGETRNVTFLAVAGTINDQIDAAYREKYSGSPYLSAMVSARARAATVKIVPRIS